MVLLDKAVIMERPMISRIMIINRSRYSFVVLDSPRRKARIELISLILKMIIIKLINLRLL